MLKDPDELLNVREVAAMLKVGVPTVRGWLYKSTFPRGIKLGDGRSAPIRWRRKDITGWLDTLQSTRAEP